MIHLGEVQITLGGIAALVLAVPIAYRVATFRTPSWIESDLRAIVWDARAAAWNASSVTGALADPRTGIARTLRNVNTLTAQVGRTSNIARLAASEQREYFRQAGVETVAALRTARGAMGRLDDMVAGANHNLNEGALPALTADLVQIRTSMEILTTDGHTALLATAGAMDQAGRVMADPSIPAAARSLAGASAGLDRMTANGAEAVGYVRDMLRPQKSGFWKALGVAAAKSVAGPLAGAFVSSFWSQNVRITEPVTVAK